MVSAVVLLFMFIIAYSSFTLYGAAVHLTYSVYHIARYISIDKTTDIYTLYLLNEYIALHIPFCYTIRKGGTDMAYTQAQNKATQKYIKENLEEVRFRVKKGERAAIKAEADINGLSMAQYIIKAVNTYAGKRIFTPTDTPDKEE